MVTGHPAPISIGTQMFSQGTATKMVARSTQHGKSIEEAMDFAASELECLLRT